MPLSVFENFGGQLIDPPALMDASVPLELSGEAVRSRLCIFTDHEGRERALRPDLTLPVAVHEAERLKNGSHGEQRYCYEARAYRLASAPGSPIEFTQIGAEQFGGPSSAEADAEMFALVAEAAKMGGKKSSTALFGDLAIFPAFVDALSIGEAAANALKRAFRQAGGVAALLNAEQSEQRSGLAAYLAGASRDDAEATVRDVLGVSGIEPIGTRTLEEIVDGLMAKSASAKAGGIPSEAIQILENVLAVEAPLQQAADNLASIAKSAELGGVEAALNALQQRIDLIMKTTPKFLDGAKFGTPFGRRFNYYDGFLFELCAPGGDTSAPFAAGGRYDTLIEKLSGGAVSANGIGGVVRPDRMGD